MLTLLRRLLSVGNDPAPEENFFISSGLEFYGDLVARASSGRIEGKFDGHIIECKKLIIGPHATIKGNVFAEEIVVYGYCEGNLYAAGEMKVYDTAVILGDIHASSLIIEHNATFRGNLRKLRTEDFLEITAKEKEKIIQQRKSNVYNIHSLNTRLEAEQRRSRKVANGLPLTGNVDQQPNAPLKRIQQASPIVVQSQDRLAPRAVVSGGDMPRAINVRESPVDVSSLSGGHSEIFVPSMDESFLPDFIAEMPQPSYAKADEPDTPANTLEKDNPADISSVEPSASMRLLDNEVVTMLVETVQDTDVTSFEAISGASMPATDEQDTFPSAIADEHMEQVGQSLETDDQDAAEAGFDLKLDSMGQETQEEQGAEIAIVSYKEQDGDIIIEGPLEIEMESELSNTIADSPVEDTDTHQHDIEVSEAVHTEQTSFFSFPASISVAFDPMPILPNDNGIRIDPAEPFIRIPEPLLRLEDNLTEVPEPVTEAQSRVMEEPTSDIEPIEGAELPLVKLESLLATAFPASMIPRQLSSPEAFELRELSTTRIFTHDDKEELFNDEDQELGDMRQEGGPELRGSKAQKTDESKLKLPAVPTAEPGYEPGYTNQQRTTRKPVTVQPENTRRWF